MIFFESRLRDVTSLEKPDNVAYNGRVRLMPVISGNASSAQKKEREKKCALVVTVIYYYLFSSTACFTTVEHVASDKSENSNHSKRFTLCLSTVKVQEARVQDVALGRETIAFVAHTRQLTTFL